MTTRVSLQPYGYKLSVLVPCAMLLLLVLKAVAITSCCYCDCQQACHNPAALSLHLNSGGDHILLPKYSRAFSMVSGSWCGHGCCNAVFNRCQNVRWQQPWFRYSAFDEYDYLKFDWGLAFIKRRRQTQRCISALTVECDPT